MNLSKIILVLVILFLTACNSSSKEEVTSEVAVDKDQSKIIYLSKEQFESANMELGELTKKPFMETVRTSGMIDVPPQSKAVISSFMGGFIKNTDLLIGDKVKKGERLVTLENPEFIELQQKYLESAAQLSYLSAEYERQQIMLDENVTSEKSFLKTESDYKSNLARYQSLKKNLRMLNIDPNTVEKGNITSQVSIYSPINGYVTQLYVSLGSHVSPADKIMEIMNTDHIHLELKVFERDLLQLKKGQKLVFEVPETTKKDLEGEVYLVGTTIDQDSRTAMVHAHIEEKDEYNFTAGMFVQAQIFTGKTELLALDEEAVIELDGNNFVLMLVKQEGNDYQFIPIEVKISNNYNGFTSFEENGKLDPEKQYLIKGGFVLLQ